MTFTNCKRLTINDTVLSILMISSNATIFSLRVLLKPQILESSNSV